MIAHTRPSRRSFLRQIAAAGAATELVAGRASASLRALGRAASAATSEDEYWAKVRGEFLLDEHLAYMNNGTLGPTPKPVYYTVVERYRELAEKPGAPNDLQRDLAEEVRGKAAAFVGADPGEIALTRNTTEGMSFIANGLDLKAGDEVLLTFHEHPGGLNPWKLKAKRHGVVLKELEFPVPTAAPADILTLFNDAITPRTRVISVSHVTYQTGCVVPVKELAALARSKGLIMLVDGAHPLGMMRLDLHALGVDYYATSPHKWLDAPTGTGLLYMRRDAQDRVWPTVVTTGWDDPTRGASRFDRLSQRAWPLVLAVGAAIDFQNAIGRDRIEQRVRALHTRLRSKVQALPGAKIYTSAHPELSCGLLGFSWDRLLNRDIVETLLRRRHTWVRSTEYGLNTVRASTHYYNTEEQVDRLVEGLQDILTNGVIPAPPLPARLDE
jgi:selenocysteine lyase/cysteine desulfurase